MKRLFPILFLLAWLLTPVAAVAEDYALDWFSVDGGGGRSADDVYEISGTAGQPDAGELGDEVYTVTGGFWAATLEHKPPAPLVLSFAVAGNSLILSWPLGPAFVLEQAFDLGYADNWHAVSQPVTVVNGRNTVIVPLSGPVVYYRLTDTPSSTLPRLTIVRAGANVALSWPGWATGYFLEESLDPAGTEGWTHVGVPMVLSAARNLVRLPANRGHAFFRLTRTLKLPSLRITLVGGNFLIAWPAPATGYFLERNLEIMQPEGWALSERPIAVTNGQNVVSVPVGEMAYYRLTSAPSPLRLRIAGAGSQVRLSWPAAAGYFLEASGDPLFGDGWFLVNAPVVVSNGLSIVTVPARERWRFFRLTRVPGPPPLQITLAGVSVVLSWPEVYRGFGLEQNPDATRVGDWSHVVLPVVNTNGLNTITLPQAGGSMYFRLTSE